MSRHTYLQETCPAAGRKLSGTAESQPATSHQLLCATDAYRGLGGFDGTRVEAGQIVLGTFRPRRGICYRWH